MNQNITGNELQLYKSFYKTYPDAILVLQEGVILMCNELAQVLFQVNDKKEILNKSIVGFLSNHSQKEFQSTEITHHLDKCLLEGKDVFDLVFQNIKGEYIDLKVFLSKIKIDGKNLIQVVLRDDTEEKQQLKSIIGALDKSAIISIADKEGKITKVNEEFCRISKYNEKELLGKDHRIVNSGYHPKEFWQEMWQTIARRKTWRKEVKNKAKDGSFYWVDTVINPMLNSEGKIISYLSIRYLITDRKEQELQIQINQEQLQTTEEELRQNLEELEAQRDYIQEINKEIKEKSEISERNSQALLKLNKSKDIHKGNLDIAFEEITTSVAKNLNIERVGIWKYDTTNEAKIIAQKQYETTKDAATFSKGVEIMQKDVPTYFADLVAEKDIVADFSQNHPALVEFVDTYLIPLKINSMLDVPYFVDGEFAGVICCETQGKYKNWTDEDIAFVKGIGDIITITIKQQQQLKEQYRVKKQNEKLAANEEVLKKTFHKMKEQELQLKESVNSLQTQEEELRQNMEELETIQEAMEQKQLQIEASKTALEKQNEKLASNEAVLKKAFQKMKTQDIKLRESYDALQTQEEELRQNMEELQTTQEAVEYQKNILEVSNRQITKSISYAETIQKAILPSETLIQEVLPESFVIYKPKDIVSGDFYWVSKHENKTLVGVIDCTGHGVPGAFMSLVASNILSEIINQRGILQPNIILQDLHKGVVKKLNQKEGANNDGMDLTLCLLEETSDNQTQLTFGGVKQNLYIIRSKELIELKGNRRSVGGGRRGDDNRSYNQESVILKKNDTVFLATDGYADQANKERKSFSKKRFRELMIEVGSLSAKEQRNILEKRLAQHQQTTEQRDDITVLGFKI
ncbi:SpoIIE family protein phosphatase [Bernardetia sp. ABR2-2B]|uniref:SpoIIE family protein phosphatase n=1 Tax=Bernardetia sp. ABR2-2B TaxID=3127472 RepID=UPI0030CCC8BE